MLVRSNALETLEHFESFECDPALRSVRAGKNRAPHGMRVQNRACIHAANNGGMQQRLRGWPPFAANHVGLLVHLEKLGGREAALVQSRRSNSQPQRVARQNRAEVSARSQDPASRIETPSNLRQACGSLSEAVTVAA